MNVTEPRLRNLPGAGNDRLNPFREQVKLLRESGVDVNVGDCEIATAVQAAHLDQGGTVDARFTDMVVKAPPKHAALAQSYSLTKKEVATTAAVMGQRFAELSEEQRDGLSTIGGLIAQGASFRTKRDAIIPAEKFFYQRLRRCSGGALGHARSRSALRETVRDAREGPGMAVPR